MTNELPNGGSLWYPQEVALRKFIQGLVLDTRSKLRTQASDLADYHNTYVDYVISLMLFATGHRPVQDLFCHRSQLDTQEGMCLICDKVVTEDRAWRLCALPPLAVTQLEAYEKHLRALTWKLVAEPKIPHSTEMAIAINTLLSAKVDNTSQLAPYFFYLSPDLRRTESVTREKIKRIWNRNIKLQPNFGRRFLATELNNRGVPADLILLQLGHQENLENPFGPQSTLTPICVLKTLGEKIDVVLRDYGWEVLTGIRTRVASGARFPEQEQVEWVHEAKEFGPQVRERSRKERRKLRADILEQVIKEVFTENTNKLASPEDIDHFLERIRDLADAQGMSANACLRLAYAWLRSKAGPKLQKKDKLRLQIVMDPDPSPVNAHTIKDYSNLRELRDRFLHFLHGRGDQISPLGFTLEDRVAEITVAAALFDGVRHPSGIQAMAESVLAETYQLEGCVFVDLVEDRARDTSDSYRWFPGDLTQALLVGLYQVLEGRHLDTVDMGSLKSSLKICMVALGVTAKRLTDLEGILNDWVNVGRLLEAPGFVRSVVTGTIRFRALPLSALVRVLTRKRLVVPPSDTLGEEDEVLERTPVWIPPVIPLSPGKDTLATREFINRYYSVKSEVYEEAKSGGHLGHNNWKKRRLSLKIKKQVTQECWPERVRLFAAWVVELCEHGTRYKNNLAYNTVTEYVDLVCVPLLELSGDSFADLTDVEYEDFYLRALFYPGSRNDKTKLAGRLREFHEFLEESFGAEEPDWSVLYQAVGLKSQSGISSNICCPWEYLTALNTILNDQRLAPKLREQYTFLLVCGYRFGLRFGEAFRLQWRSVQTDPVIDEIWIQIRNSVFGTVKTESSTRQTPLIGELTKAEDELIRLMLSSVSEDSRVDPLTGFMHQDGSTRELIDRAAASQYLNALLKAVTGDRTSRYHHLRHTWAMQRLAEAMRPVKEDGAWSTFSKAITDDGRFTGGERSMWGEEDIDTRYLQAISLALGHASEETTLTSYIHVTDVYSAEVAESSGTLHDTVLSYALGVTPAALRQRRSRSRPDSKRMARDYFLPSAQQHQVPAPEIDVTDEAPEVFALPYEATQTVIALTQIERALGVVGRRSGDRGGLAENLRLTQAGLEKILSAADAIESQSGFSRYHLILAGSDPLLKSERANMGPPVESREGVRRLRKLLHWLDGRLIEMENDLKAELNNAMRAWSRAYSPSKRSPIFSKLADADSFLRGCELLGIKVDWKAYCSSREAGQIGDWALSHGISCDVQKGRLRPHEKSRRRKRSWIRLVPTNLNHDVMAIDTLNRIFFILAVWCMVNGLSSLGSPKNIT